MSGNGNGKAKGKDGFEEIAGKPVKERPKKGKRIAGPPAAARTAHLPGMEPVKIATVHAAIEAFVCAQIALKDQTKKRDEAKAALLRAMKEAAIDKYIVDGHVAFLDVEETVKARLEPEDAEEAEERELSGGPPRVRSQRRGSRAPEASA
jgi:hypothetical protein